MLFTSILHRIFDLFGRQCYEKMTVHLLYHLRYDKITVTKP